MKKRYIPNVLSMVRIPFSIAMPFLGQLAAKKNNPYPFLAVYAVAGIADVLDGFLARRYHWESKLGAKMDSIGDTIFLVCAIGTTIWCLPLKFEWYVFAALGLLVALRVANAVFTRVKFKQWGFIQNLFVKFASVPIFFLLPLFIYYGRVLNEPLTAMIGLVILATIEETWILCIMEEYDMNMKSIYHMKKLKKRRAAECEAREEIAA